MNRLRQILRKFNYIWMLLIVLIVCGFYVHTIYQDSTYKASEDSILAETGEDLTEAAFVSQPETVNDEQQDIPFRLTILDVGQGSCALIESNGLYMLFDGGDRETSSYVVSYLKSRGIERIDVMVASHYHSDHIYGLIGVLETMDVDKVICPDYVSDTGAYKSFMQRVPYDKQIHPYAGQKFTMGDVCFTVICPVMDDYSDDNGYSVGMIGTYGNFRFLIDGDATQESEEDMLSGDVDLSADLLVVPHHGSTYSSCSDWLDAVSPQVAVISCGEGNEYYHPHLKTLERLRECGIKQLYRTDLNGAVTVTSDGVSFQVLTEKVVSEEELWQQGSGGKTDTGAIVDIWKTTDETVLENYYVGNINSKKFHRPDCTLLPAEDKQVLFESRDSALLEGYIPCGACNP